MNLALAYHKCLDDWQDDRSVAGRAEAKLLAKHYRQIEARYPGKCEVIEDCLRQIGEMEHAGCAEPDGPANLSGRMLGEVFAWREDYWTPTLRTVGEALGRFIYVMDAYDDLPADLRKKRFNPLARYREQPDYEEFCKESLTLLIAECTRAFEVLPLTQDVEILRNILYSGVWNRYQLRQERPDRKRGKLKEREND